MRKDRPMLNITKLPNLLRQANKARDVANVTCGASRHVHLLAEDLASCPLFLGDLRRDAESMLSALVSLWEARAELAQLKAQEATDAASK